MFVCSPLSHLELCWSVRTAFLLVRLLKMAASVPMKSMYMPENSSWSRGMHTHTQQINNILTHFVDLKKKRDTNAQFSDN